MRERRAAANNEWKKRHCDGETGGERELACEHSLLVHRRVVLVLR
jgi:hypothetical protein